MQHFFQTAPQNPYIFGVLVVLAVVSAWQPLKKTLSTIRAFYTDVVHRGMRRAIASTAEYTDRTADRIVANPANGALELLIGFRWSMQMVLNAILLFIIGFAILAAPPALAAPFSVTAQRFFGVAALLVACLASLVWLIEASLQTTIASKVLKRLRKHD